MLISLFSPSLPFLHKKKTWRARGRLPRPNGSMSTAKPKTQAELDEEEFRELDTKIKDCLLYTSDAADE